MDYAIIRVGGKQYRVREGETLLVDRLKADEGNTFTPELLLGADGATVTAKIVGHERGPKIRIGKVKRRTGYKRHTGYRSALTRIQIESLGAGTSVPRAAAPKAAAPKDAAPKDAAPKDAAPKDAAPKDAAPKDAAPKVAAPKVEAAPAPPAAGPSVSDASASDLPAGYDGMTVAQIQAAAGSWSAGELAGALEYEQAHAKRKGALAALTSAIEKGTDA